jgi:hypothetical protein
MILILAKETVDLPFFSYKEIKYRKLLGSIWAKFNRKKVKVGKLPKNLLIGLKKIKN